MTAESSLHPALGGGDSYCPACGREARKQRAKETCPRSNSWGTEPRLDPGNGREPCLNQPLSRRRSWEPPVRLHNFYSSHHSEAVKQTAEITLMIYFTSFTLGKIFAAWNQYKIIAVFHLLFHAKGSKCTVCLNLKPVSV